MADEMRLIIVSGLSGSGKTVALHVLEDLGYYCIDNMPAALLDAVVAEVRSGGETPANRIAVGVDARNRAKDLDALPGLIEKLDKSGVNTDLLYLQASDEVLMKRYSESRRRHRRSLACNKPRRLSRTRLHPPPSLPRHRKCRDR
jgi:UPF0042 nucleotide-binding protein